MFKISLSRAEVVSFLEAENQRGYSILKKGDAEPRYILLKNSGALHHAIFNIYKRVMGFLLGYKACSLESVFPIRPQAAAIHVNPPAAAALPAAPRNMYNQRQIDVIKSELQKLLDRLNFDMDYSKYDAERLRDFKRQLTGLIASSDKTRAFKDAIEDAYNSARYIYRSHYGYLSPGIGNGIQRPNPLEKLHDFMSRGGSLEVSRAPAEINRERLQEVLAKMQERFQRDIRYYLEANPGMFSVYTGYERCIDQLIEQAQADGITPDSLTQMTQILDQVRNSGFGFGIFALEAKQLLVSQVSLGDLAPAHAFGGLAAVDLQRRSFL